MPGIMPVGMLAYFFYPMPLNYVGSTKASFPYKFLDNFDLLVFKGWFECNLLFKNWNDSF